MKNNKRVPFSREYATSRLCKRLVKHNADLGSGIARGGGGPPQRHEFWGRRPPLALTCGHRSLGWQVQESPAPPDLPPLTFNRRARQTLGPPRAARGLATPLELGITGPSITDRTGMQPVKEFLVIPMVHYHTLFITL